MDLFDAFDLKPGAVVAAVGGGGKTSLVYALADQAAAMGLPAIVTSTTRFTRRAGGPMPRVIEMPGESALARLRDELRPGEAIVASRGRAPQARLVGFEPETIDLWADMGAGVIAIEADGSARRSFKAPADHEPVIPSRTTDVVVCVGLDVLGKPLEEANVHRPEIVARLAKAELGDPVTMEMIMRVLVHEEGGRKGVPQGARLHALLNNPGDDEQREVGTKLAGRLIFGGFYRAIVATVHRAEIDMIACQMPWFRRKPRITDHNYGRLMTSFGRVVDRDPFIARPATALAERVADEEGELIAAVDERLYRGAAVYHLRLLAGSWLMAAEGSVPRATAEIFEEAVAWKFGPVVKGSGRLAHRVSELARGEAERID